MKKQLILFIPVAICLYILNNNRRCDPEIYKETPKLCNELDELFFTTHLIMLSYVSILLNYLLSIYSLIFYYILTVITFILALHSSSLPLFESYDSEIMIELFYYFICFSYIMLIPFSIKVIWKMMLYIKKIYYKYLL